VQNKKFSGVVTVAERKYHRRRVKKGRLKRETQKKQRDATGNGSGAIGKQKGGGWNSVGPSDEIKNIEKRKERGEAVGITNYIGGDREDWSLAQ